MELLNYYLYNVEIIKKKWNSKIIYEFKQYLKIYKNVCLKFK